MPRRVILANRADADRFAVFAGTSGWVLEASAIASATTPELIRWRTRGGLGVTLLQDPLLQRPMVEFDPARAEYATAEADELEQQLPRLFQVIRFADARETMAGLASSADRGRMLPILAATALGQDPAHVAEVSRLVGTGLTAADGQLRASAVVAAAYLDDPALLAAARELAADDPEPRTRRLAARLAWPPPAPAAGIAAVHPVGASSDGLRRITFATGRIRDQFVPFANAAGWVLAGHRPAAADESESYTWHAEAGVTIALIADLRLNRELVTLLTAKLGKHHVLDDIEQLIRDRFEAIDLDQALDLLSAMPDSPARMDLLKAVVASAPASYRPRFLSVMSELLGSSAASLRGFTAGVTVYFPWPQTRPFLDWMAEHDPDPTVRAMSRIGIAAVRDVCGDSADPLTPPVTYYIEDAVGGQAASAETSLLRRVHLAPQIDQRLGEDVLWRHAKLPADFPAGYRETSFRTAGQIADMLASRRRSATCEQGG